MEAEHGSLDGRSLNGRSSEPGVAARIGALVHFQPEQGQCAAAAPGYQAVVDGVRELSWSVPAIRLYPVVVAQLELGRQLVRLPGPSERIATSMAQAALIAGRMAQLDLSVPDDADAHFVEAAMAAYQGADPLLTAAALGHRALVASSAGEHEKARSLEANAVSAATRASEQNPGVNAWLRVVSAEVDRHSTAVADRTGPGPPTDQESPAIPPERRPTRRTSKRTTIEALTLTSLPD